ncbi:tetracyclin repressor [Mycobacterium avium subsp. paratuberculosis 08-8281]|nr:tetracyclin repressor [Mycobacterium avium subsp. paratuberculosis 08-8281]ETB35227.1 tetracyclin repressor [Mycobacterium avium subsp. paratuberculosis 11-1786]
MVFERLSLDTTTPDWAAALRKLGHEFRDLARAHPNVVPLLVTRPLATPLGMRPPGILRHLEEVLTLLIGAGFTGEDALHVYRALFGFLYGHVLTELQEIVERPEETDHVLRLGLHRLPIDQFGHLRELAPVWASYDPLAELDRGLDILLSGLAVRLTIPGAAPADTTEPQQGDHERT